MPKTLSERWHSCPECGLEGPRDQISAIISQHNTFGTLPALVGNVLNREPGLGDLERAVARLELRRGENKSKRGENLLAEQKTASAVEFSVKRPAPRRTGTGKTTGAGKTASVEAETVDHNEPGLGTGLLVRLRRKS